MFVVITASSGCLPDGEPEEYDTYNDALERVKELFEDEPNARWVAEGMFSHGESSLYYTYIEEW